MIKVFRGYSMVREIIIPDNERYSVHIPKEYINQKVEILIIPFPSNDKVEKMENEFNPSKYYDVSNISKADIDNYLMNSRNEWENEQ